MLVLEKSGNPAFHNILGRRSRLVQFDCSSGCVCIKGLPDFQATNPNLGKFGRALCRIENVGIVYTHLEYIVFNWCILLSFDNFVVIFCRYFHRVGIQCQEKSGNPVASASQLLPDRVDGKTLSTG
jgi:hypothetical protein